MSLAPLEISIVTISHSEKERKYIYKFDFWTLAYVLSVHSRSPPKLAGLDPKKMLPEWMRHRLGIKNDILFCKYFFLQIFF
jgi:hypothetical protein